MEQRLGTPAPSTTPAPYLGSSVKLVLGLFLAALGLLLTLDNLDVLDADPYLHFAPAILIVIGLIKLRDPMSRGLAIVLIVGGALLLVWSTSVLRFSIFDLWPLMFIVIGSFIVAQALGFRPNTGGPAVTGGVMNLVTVFSSRKETIVSPDFKGGRILSLMGGCELDLTGAGIETGPAILEIVALMSGIEILVPEGWDVVGDALPIMGGVDIKTSRSAVKATGARKQLILRGLVTMAGVEVKAAPVRNA